MSNTLVFVGTLIYSECQERVTVIEDGILIVKEGKIAAAEALAGRNPDSVVASILGLGTPAPVRRLLPDEMLLPGFVDTHVHAPQFPNAGLGYDKTLLDWLDTYTFPLEARYHDEAYASRVYDGVVRRMLNAGTTLACYFATIHAGSSFRLAQSVEKCGQRALVGKVNMNINAPPNLQETRQQSLRKTKDFIKCINDLKNPLIKPVITPRFALNCDMDHMKELADLARAEELHIQTHVSETLGEIEAVKVMFPQCENYVDVYDKAGLISEKTVLAHGVHLTDKELRKLAQSGTAIAHCPTSNTCLKSGMCDVRRLLRAGVTVGLGSDVSGGPTPSILNVVRAALDTSIHISFAKGPDYFPLTYQETFHLATLGGAEALAMSEQVGNFIVGKEFDALLVNSPCQDIQKETLRPLEMLQKFLYCGSEQDIKEVYVRGQQVKHAN